MADSLIECIPNFSEACNSQTISQIRDAIMRVEGAVIIDQHSDYDHNRTVITILGSPSAIENAAFQGIAKAAELIDMNSHQGQHPRIGAADVVPFIPIRNASMVDCVEIARRLGRRVGSELNIPVYLYEEAATREDRKHLENIRRGQYEGLRDEILSNPSRIPDFGPARLGTPGATAIGARNPLIAFNVYLSSSDIETAKKIAAVVRHSSGGLRYVKALGMLVNGYAQVSMNLTDFKQTPIHQVVEMVRREALRYGSSIHHTELVGLIPQDALINSAQWYLQLDQFSPDQILETRIAAALSGVDQKNRKNQDLFLDKLSSGDDFPGAIAAISHTIATALALIAMTARQATEKSNSPETRTRMISLIERVESHRLDLDLAEKAITFAAKSNVFLFESSLVLDPEQAAVKREQKEVALQEKIQHMQNFANQCISVLNLSLVIGENCENINLHNLGTAAKLTLAAFDCVKDLILLELKQVNNDQFALVQDRSLHQKTALASQSLERLFVTINE